MKLKNKHKYMLYTLIGGTIIGLTALFSLPFESQEFVEEPREQKHKQNIVLEETGTDSHPVVDRSVDSFSQAQLDNPDNSSEAERIQLIDPEEYAALPKVTLDFVQTPPPATLKELTNELLSGEDVLLEKYGPEYFEEPDLSKYGFEKYLDLSAEELAEIRSKYTQNYHKHNEYNIRSDLYAPLYNEPVTDDAILTQALHGIEVDNMIVSLHTGLTEYSISDIANQLQSVIGYPITVTDIHEFTKRDKRGGKIISTALHNLNITIHYPFVPTSQEVEYVKTQTKALPYVRRVTLRKSLLPEYDQLKYIKLVEKLEEL